MMLLKIREELCIHPMGGIRDGWLSNSNAISAVALMLTGMRKIE